MSAKGNQRRADILVRHGGLENPPSFAPLKLYGQDSRSAGKTDEVKFASLNSTGRAAIVLDTGAASPGPGNAGTNKEKTVRQEIGA